jgi:hypothetical protein
VDLKHVLCQIQTNAGNVHFGLLSSWDWLLTSPVWHIDAVAEGRSPSHWKSRRLYAGAFRRMIPTVVHSAEGAIKQLFRPTCWPRKVGYKTWDKIDETDLYYLNADYF